MKNRIMLYLFCCFLFSGCSSGSERYLEHALEYANENRSELEKVLSHYARPEDSLKLRAAKFLIENMPGHYSYKGDYVLNYYREIDPILTDTVLTTKQIRIQLELIAARYPDLSKNVVEDIKIITSDYLIKNIDDAFVLWEKPWASHLSFDEFCEALLPYKTIELQSLDYWRDTLSAKFGSKFDTWYRGTDRNCPVEHYKTLIEDVVKVNPQVHTNGANYYKPMAASNISNLRIGTCEDYMNMVVPILRSKGLPVMLEHFPIWGTRTNLGHTYISLINKSNIYIPINGSYEEPGSLFLAKDYVPKIFRRTYAYNKRVLEYYKDTKYRCPNINLFDMDVTERYCSVSELAIPVNTSGIKDKYAYLSVFNGSKWQVLDFGIIERRKARFSNVGRGNVYLIQGFDGVSLVPISIPFILGRNGTIRYIESDSLHTQTVSLSRKYPVTDNIAYYKHMAKGELHASNCPDFSTYDKIIDVMYPGSNIAFNTGKSYRYWRYYSKPDSWCNIAELLFFPKYPIKEIITNIQEKTEGECSIDKAFDGDWLTNCISNMASGSWIGLDFGKPVVIESFLCVPRGDDNDIHLGDKYELNGWIQNKWKKFGMQIAENNPLVFDSIPCNTILWLRNLTQGTQERIFLYEKDQQIFW